MNREVAKYLGLISNKKPKDKLILTTVERQIVALHLEGKETHTICRTLEVSPAKVYAVLRSTAAQNIINDFFQFQDQELKVLYSLAVGAIRSGLTNADDDIKLRAADRYFKIHGKYKSDAPRETAEDVVRRIMEVTQKTPTGSTTIKLTEELPKTADQ